jgi:cytochrome b pre-mRNA-processing protein 3
MIFKRFFAKKSSPAETLYLAIVAAARQPEFYAELGVPDTVDGRFDLIVAHLYLVLGRLKSAAPVAAQELTDFFFVDMDRSLREMGVGDLGVAKRVRQMAEAFYGRVQAYDAGFAQGEAALIEAVQRNIYAGVTSPHAHALVAWFRSARNSLEMQNITDIAKAQVKFT